MLRDPAPFLKRSFFEIPLVRRKIRFEQRT